MAEKKKKAELLSVDDCACRLGISSRTVLRLIVAGVISGFQAGHQWRVRAHDLDAYIVSRTSRRCDAA
jgi:excisionase family DNA binding protein